MMDSHPEECSSKASDSDDEDWATATDATASADPMVFVEIDGWITIRMKKSVADLVCFVTI